VAVSVVVFASLPVPVTVKTYVPVVVPAVPVVLLVFEEEEPPPQALRLPSSVINTRTPSIDRQPRRRAGIPRKTTKARSAPPAAPKTPRFLPGSFGETRLLVVAAVVLIVAVAVPLVVLELSATVVGLIEQLGK